MRTRKAISILFSLLLVVIIIYAFLFLIGYKIGVFERWIRDYHLGKITEIRGSEIVIEGRDGTDTSVLLDNQTLIKRGKNIISRKNLQKDEYVIVFGFDTSQTSIKAQIIHILNKPPRINSRGF